MSKKTKEKYNPYIEVNKTEDVEIDGHIFKIKTQLDGEDYMIYSRNAISADSKKGSIKEKDEGYTVSVGVAIYIADLPFPTITGKNWVDESFENRVKTVQKLNPNKIYLPLAKICMGKLKSMFSDKGIKKKSKTTSGSGKQEIQK